MISFDYNALASYFASGASLSRGLHAEVIRGGSLGRAISSAESAVTPPWPQLRGSLFRRQVSHGSQLGSWHHGPRPAQARAVSPDPSEAGPDPFGDSRLFEFS